MICGRGARGLLVFVLLLAFLAGLVNWIYTRSLLERNAQQSHQSRTNRSFVLDHSSLREALESYPGAWPPLYPIALRTASAIGLPIRRVNQLLFCAMLAWIFFFVRRRISEIHWWWPLLFFCLASFHYDQMSQFVPENLFLPLSLLTFSALMGYLERPTSATLLTLSLLGAAACVTKYIGLFWLLPILAARVFFSGLTDRATRVVHVIAICLICMLPVGLWMGYQFHRTGFMTGYDRFEPRAPSPELAELTSLGSNVSLTSKTLLVDFLSISRNADHATINHAYRLEWTHYAFAALILLMMLALAKDGGPILHRGWADRVAWRELWKNRFWLMAALVGSYLVALIALWTVGNNDPIYSRFVSPAYPFLILLGFAFYARVRRFARPSRWTLLPFWALYGLLILVHFHKTIVLQRVEHTLPWS